MNDASSSIAMISDRIATIESRFSGRPPVADSILGGTPSSRKGADTATRDSALSFNTMVDRLVSQTADGGSASSTLNDLLSTFLEQQSAPVGTRGGPVTTVLGGPSEAEDAPAATSANGEQIVALASEYLGVPYVWGGEDPSGFDCSGLIQHVYAKVGIDLPRVSRDQARVGLEVPNLDAAVPGDLVAFGQPVDHIGIYAGNGNMVVAPRTGDVVKVQRISREPVTIRRILIPDQIAQDTSAVGVQSSDPASTYRPLFAAAEAKYGVPAELLEAVAKQESRFDPTAVSSAGAQGLMQLMPETARALGVDAFDPPAAVDGAARLLSQHLRKFDSVPLALAAYNAGPGAVTRHNGIPPYRETRNYVAKILADLEDNSRVAGAGAAPAAGSLPGLSPGSDASSSFTQSFRSPPFLFQANTGANTGASQFRSSLVTVPAAGTTAPAPPVNSNPVSTATATVGSSPTPPPAGAATASTSPTPAVAVVAAPKPVVGPGADGWAIPTGPLESPAKGAWGPSTQTQVTSVGGEGTVSWAASGLLAVAEPGEVTAVAASATGPVAKGVLKILQNATAAQMASPEFRQTLNDVNRDALGLPNAPDVIPVQPPAVAPTATATAAPAAAPVGGASTPTTVGSLAKPLTGASAVGPAPTPIAK